MIKCKIFSMAPLTADVPLEPQINNWLNDHPNIKVISTDIYGTTSSHGIVGMLVYVVMYEELKTNS